MNENIGQAQHQILKRRVDDVIYYAEKAEMFLQLTEEANELMAECLKQLPEDIVVSYMQKLSSTTINRAHADRAYQLIKSAYVSIHPESIVGEM